MASKLYTKAFWTSVAERTGFTFLEAYLAFILISAVATAGLTDIDWLGGLNIAGLAAVIALIKNVLTAQVTDGSPSATNTEAVKPSL